MKSELYKAIYKMSIFCALATGFLVIAAGVVGVFMYQKPSGKDTAFWITIGVALFGVLLLGAAIAVAVTFYRHYQKMLLIEQQESEQAAQE